MVLTGVGSPAERDYRRLRGAVPDGVAPPRPPLGLTEAAPALAPASQPRPNPSTPRELGVPPSRNTTARHPSPTGLGPLGNTHPRAEQAPAAPASLPFVPRSPRPSRRSFRARTFHTLPGIVCRRRPAPGRRTALPVSTRRGLGRQGFFKKFRQAPGFPQKSSNLDPVPVGRRFVTARRAEKAGPRCGPWFAARRQELRRLRARGFTEAVGAAA